MKMLRFWAALGAMGSALCGAGLAPLWAGPPYLTDDPDPVPLHH